jgi:hypothetical protein
MNGNEITKFKRTPFFYIWALIVLGGLFYFIIKTFQAKSKRMVFVENELHGKLIDIENHGRNMAGVKIVVPEGDTLEVSLSIDKFLRDHQIKIGDSLSKSSNSRTVWFFKRTAAGEISDPIEYQCPM